MSKIQYQPISMPPFKWMGDKPRWLNLCAAWTMTADYDPMYVVLDKLKAELSERSFYNFLLAYILFYDAGTAAKIAQAAEAQGFWQCVLDAFPKAKRGSSRRYFRGEQGMTAINYFQEHYQNPKDFFDRNHSETYEGLVKNLSNVPQFGEYFIWKMMDIYDRVLAMPVAVNQDSIKRLPNAPRKGSKLVAEEMGLEDDFVTVVNYMVGECQKLELMALPNGDRLVGIPEVETFLCGIYHHYRSRDYMGKDMAKILDSIEGDNSVLAEMIRSACPSRVADDWFVEPGQTAPAKTNSLFDFMGG